MSQKPYTFQLLGNESADDFDALPSFHEASHVCFPDALSTYARQKIQRVSKQKGTRQEFSSLRELQRRNSKRGDCKRGQENEPPVTITLFPLHWLLSGRILQSIGPLYE